MGEFLGRIGLFIAWIIFGIILFIIHILSDFVNAFGDSQKDFPTIKSIIVFFLWLSLPFVYYADINSYNLNKKLAFK